MTLFKQQLKNEWVSILVWSLVMSGLVYTAVLLWDVMRQSGGLAELQAMVASMPEAMKALYGDGVVMTELAGWLQGYAFGGWLSVPYVIFTGLFAAGIVTREMDRRTMDFLLSLPVARWQVLVYRWAGMVGALTVMHLVHFGAVTAAVRAIGEQPLAAEFMWASFNSLLLFVALGSVMLLVSLFLDDYGRGVSVLLGLGLGLFFFHLGTADSEGALKTVRGILPFAMYDPGPILLKAEVPVGDMITLASIGLASLGLSVYLFQRKQVSV